MMDSFPRGNFIFKLFLKLSVSYIFSNSNKLVMQIKNCVLSGKLFCTFLGCLVKATSFFSPQLPWAHRQLLLSL